MCFWKQGGERAGDLDATTDDVLDVHGDGIENMAVEVDNYWAQDVVDFDEEEDDDDDDDDTAGVGGEKSSAGSPQAASSAEEAQEGDSGQGGGQPGWPPAAPDFAGADFCGDLVDQMAELHPDQHIAFKMDRADYEFPEDDGYWGGNGTAGQHRSSSLSRRSVLADLVMPYGDPRGEGGQGVVSIPIKIVVQETDDDDDEDD